MRGAFRHAPAQGLGRIGPCVRHQLAFVAAPGRHHPHPPAAMHRKRVVHQRLVLQAVADQHQPGHRLVGVELAEEGFQHRRRMVVAGVAGEIGAAAVVAAGAEEKDLDAGLPPGLMRREDVRLLDALQVDVLVRLDAGEGADAVAELGRLLELQDVAGFLHAHRQMALDGLAVAFEEGMGLGHQGGVVRAADPLGARRATALDLMEQAGPRAVGENRIGARAQQEHALQHGQGLVDRPGRGEGTEVIALAVARTAVLEHPGKGVVRRHQDGRERFVVAQVDVVAGRVAFDQVGFQQQRLGLGVGGDEFHGRRLRHHAVDAVGEARRAGVAFHPLLQVLRLAHVEDVAAAVDHAVDAGRRRQHLEMGFDDRDAGGARGCVPALQGGRLRRAVRFHAHTGYLVDSRPDVNAGEGFLPGNS